MQIDLTSPWHILASNGQVQVDVSVSSVQDDSAFPDWHGNVRRRKVVDVVSHGYSKGNLCGLTRLFSNEALQLGSEAVLSYLVDLFEVCWGKRLVPNYWKD